MAYSYQASASKCRVHGVDLTKDQVPHLWTHSAGDGGTDTIVKGNSGGDDADWGCYRKGGLFAFVEETCGGKRCGATPSIGPLLGLDEEDCQQRCNEDLTCNFVEYVCRWFAVPGPVHVASEPLPTMSLTLTPVAQQTSPCVFTDALASTFLYKYAHTTLADCCEQLGPSIAQHRCTCVMLTLVRTHTAARHTGATKTGGTGCVKVVTGTQQSDNGIVNVYVDQGLGFSLVTQESKPYDEGTTVLDACYGNLLGLQVKNPDTDGWAGSILFSRTDGSPYHPGVCR